MSNCFGRSVGRFVAGLILPCLASKPLLGQDGIWIDAATMRGKRIQGSKVEFKSGQAFRIRKQDSLAITVTGRNSALYSCSLEAEAVPDPDRSALATWLKGLGPYLPILAEGSFPSPAARLLEYSDKDAVKRVADRADRLKKALAALDELLNSERGAISIRLVQLEALDQLALAGDAANKIESAVDAYNAAMTRIQCRDGNCLKLAPLLATLTEVQTAARELREASSALRPNKIAALGKALTTHQQLTATLQTEVLAQPSSTILRDSIATISSQTLQLTELFFNPGKLSADEDALLDAAASAVGDTDNIRNLMLSLRSWHERIQDARAELDCGKIVVTGDSGRKVAVTVAPLEAPEVEGLALAENGFKFGFTATASRRLRLGVGLAFMGAPGAIYSSFGASEADGTVTVIETGQQDLRFNYGLTLGVAAGPPRVLGKESLVWWPLEATVLPSDNVRGFGLGTALSYNFIKLGAGLMWAKHDVLADANPLASTIPTKDDLKLRSSFRDPKVYVSISLIGLPPFIPE